MLQEDGWLAGWMDGWLVDVSVKENQPTNMMVSYLVIQSVCFFLFTVIANNFCILAISKCWCYQVTSSIRKGKKKDVKK